MRTPATVEAGRPASCRRSLPAAIAAASLSRSCGPAARAEAGGARQMRHSLIVVCIVILDAGRGGLIDAGLGDRGQLLIGRLFFRQSLLKQAGDVAEPEGFRPGDARAIRRHLVMLGFLARGDDARIHDRPFFDFLEHRIALFDNALYAFAQFALRLLIEQPEDLLEPTELIL